MHKSENNFEKIFEDVLKKALAENAQNELLKLESEIICSEPTETEENVIKKVLKKSRRKSFSFAKLATAAAAVVVITLTVMNPHVSAFFSGLIKNVFPDHTTYQVVNGGEITPENFDFTIRPNVIPSGFKLTEVEATSLSMWLVYKNDNDDYIEIDVMIADGSTLGVDNEHSVAENTIINGNDAVFQRTIFPEYPSFLIWEDGGYLILIMSNMEFDVIKEVAESMKFM